MWPAGLLRGHGARWPMHAGRARLWHVASVRWSSRVGEPASVTVTEKRLREFVNAEIGYFAGMCAQPVKLAQIFTAGTLESAASLIHKHFPVHFATRIRQIEALPHWDAVPELLDVHDTLSESFRNLRLLDSKSSDLEPLTRCIHDLRSRHKGIVCLLGIAMASLRAEGVVDEAFANDWLNRFLLARISTEMLTTHYILLASGEGARGGGSCCGIVDSRCDPGEICRQAVSNICRDPRFSAIDVRVESHVCWTSEKGPEFSFLPQYLQLLVEEVLKNSAWATVRAASSSSSARTAPGASSADGRLSPITIFVGSDDRQVMIEISDKGGGIPPQQQDRIWSYCGGAGVRIPSYQQVEEASAAPHKQLGFSWMDPLSGIGLKQRLGMGLPLTRLYTEYLGGKLELMSIPGVGVDTFINLRRIDSESLDSLG
mmetsp:Transcript_64538/g.180433  ORF Transcript_64538/g.180433 Transcript_64538/m.180433 type:complete len:429 (-) Transcript_64538:126-1412(-)